MHSISKLLAGSIVAFGAARTAAANVQFAGVNIAGFDFGCSTDVHHTHILFLQICHLMPFLTPTHRAHVPLHLSIRHSNNMAVTTVPAK